MKAVLRRHSDTPFGVFGYLDLYDAAGVRVARFETAEEDWLDNQPSISCIPAGTYKVVKRFSPKFQTITPHITGVPGRQFILIHWGNTEEDVEGCVLVGTRYGSLQKPDEDAPGKPVTVKWAVLSSKLAFDRLMKLLQDVEEFPLEVRWEEPGGWR